MCEKGLLIFAGDLYNIALLRRRQAMSVTFLQDGTELLKIYPQSFRRVYTLDLDNDADLKYSHSDVVIKLDNDAQAMIEIVQAMLPDGNYSLKMMPTEVTFVLRHKQKGIECMNWLKKLIFMNFPDLETSDMYGNEKLR